MFDNNKKNHNQDIILKTKALKNVQKLKNNYDSFIMHVK